MGGSSEIMAGRGWRRQNYGWSWMVVGGGGRSYYWLWVVAAKLWLVMGGRRWWRQNYGWSWVVVSGGSKIMAGRGWSHDSVMPNYIYF